MLNSLRAQKQIKKNLILKTIFIIALLTLLTLALSKIKFAAQIDHTVSGAISKQSQVSLSGELSAQLDISAANISCINNNLEILLPATNGLNGYRISLKNVNLDVKNEFSSLGDNFALELIDQNNRVYSSFLATDSELYLNASSGTITGFLVNEYKHQAYISLTWVCP